MIFIITGTLKNGKRFKPIRTIEPANYNIYKGTIWIELPDGKRRRHYTITN